MQSLGQAVFRYICKRSREGHRLSRTEIVEEMRSRGYLEPLRKRVDRALNDYSGMGRITEIGRKYVKTSLVEKL